MAEQGAKRMGILVEDSELDNLYEEWEETLPIHGLSWEIYVARIQLKKVAESGEFEDKIVPQIEGILVKYKNSLHKETPFAKSEANIDFRNFAAHDICGVFRQALKKEAGL